MKGDLIIAMDFAAPDADRTFIGLYDTSGRLISDLSSTDRKRDKRARMSEAQNHRCAYCGVVFSDDPDSPDYATFDHVIQRRLGGWNSEDNLVMACFSCNNIRGDEDAMSFFDRQGWLNPDDRSQVTIRPILVPAQGSGATLADIWPAALRPDTQAAS